MSTPWPSTLPQKPVAFKYGETEPSNTIRQNMQVGPPKSRPLSSAKGEELDLVFIFTGTQKATFRTLYRTTLSWGSLPYEWTHPDTKSTKDFVFMTEPSYKFIGGEYTSYWECSFKVYVKP